MRKASMILGIIGGAIAIIISLFVIFAGAMFAFIVPSYMETTGYNEGNDVSDQYETDISVDFGEEIASIIFFAFGGTILIFGILGLVGAILVNKKNVMSGIFMLISGTFLLLTLYGFIAAVLMILGGIFALIKDNNNQVPIVAQA